MVIQLWLYFVIQFFRDHFWIDNHLNYQTDVEQLSFCRLTLDQKQNWSFVASLQLAFTIAF